MLIALLISSILHFILYKGKSNVLGCGLVGFCGDKPSNLDKIRILLMYNLSRGSHATGVCINDQVTKDTSAVPTFLANNELSYNQKENFTVLAHARQASIGAKEDVKLAHPFIFPSKKGALIGMHNGTITNIYDICKKYNAERNYQLSDSYQLFDIMSKLEDPSEVIQYIEGPATLMYYFSTVPNEVNVFRDPNRELYCWHKSKNETYISSIIDSLYAIGGNKDTVFEYTANNLYLLKKGTCVKKTSIERKGYSHYKETRTVTQPKSIHNNYRNNYCDFYEKKHVTKRSDGKLYWDSHLYYQNGVKYTGIRYINSVGSQKTAEEYARMADDLKADGDYTQYWFAIGMLCKSRQDYITFIDKFCKGTILESNLKEAENLIQNKYCEYIQYPIQTKLPTLFTFKSELKLGEVYTWKPLLSDMTFKAEILSEHHLELKSSLTKAPDYADWIGKSILIKHVKSATELYAMFVTYAKAVSKNIWDFKYLFQSNYIAFFESVGMSTEGSSKVLLNKSFESVLEHEFEFMFKSYRDTKEMEIKKAYGYDNPIVDHDTEFHEVDDDDVVDVSVDPSRITKALKRWRDNARLYNMDEFRSHVSTLQSKTIDELLMVYVSMGDEDEYEDFWISVALCLNYLGFATDEQVVSVMDSPAKLRADIVGGLWKDYVAATALEVRVESLKNTIIKDWKFLKEQQLLGDHKGNLNYYKKSLKELLKKASNGLKKELEIKYGLYESKLEEVYD